MSVAGRAGEARDDLFPDLDGDDLVWMQSYFDAEAAGADPGADEETDCLACPYCSGCRLDVVYRRLPDGPLEVLHEGFAPRSGPRVGDGLAVWRDDQGQVWARDLAGGDERAVPARSWIQTTPTPHAGKLWWWGYDGNIGYTIFSYDFATQALVTVIERYLNIRSNQPMTSSQLASVAQRQPFWIADDGIYFVTWDSRSQIKRWPWEGEPELLLASDALDFQNVVPRADGSLVTMVVDRTEVCERGLCDLSIESFGADGLEPLAIDALPTRYVQPAMAGDRFVWVDYRDGPYAIYGVDPGGRETRLSSDLAEIGALSNVTASGRRVVWADHRAGRWRLVANSPP